MEKTFEFLILTLIRFISARSSAKNKCPTPYTCQHNQYDFFLFSKKE